MWPAVIPQMDLHALSTIFLPTVHTFLPLWHNVLPIITLDCLISSYHKVTRCEIILQFPPLRFVVNQSPSRGPYLYPSCPTELFGRKFGRSSAKIYLVEGMA